MRWVDHFHLLKQFKQPKHFKMLKMLAIASALFASSWVCADDNTVSKKASTNPPVPAFQLPPVDLGATAADVAQADSLVMLKAVQFKGNTIVTTDQLNAIAAPYLARPNHVSELEELRQKLSRYYLELGYVNSGVLWDGAVSEGVIHFKVIEGQLSSINLSGMNGLDTRYVTQRLSKSGDGPFNVNLLRERFQMLLADPLFQRLNARLIPGEQAGEAILDIEVLRARPYQLTVFANNYRPPSIGANAVGLDLMVRNLTSQGDVLDANVQSSAKFIGDERANLSWHMPIGYAGTALAIVIDKGSSSVIEQPAAVLDIRSKLSSNELGLSQILSESLNQKFSLGLNYIRRENRSTLLGIPYSFTPNEPDGVTKESLWRFWQDYSYRTPVQVFALRSTFTMGHNNLQEVAGLPSIESPSKTYRLWMGQAQWSRQLLDNGAQLVVRGTLQRSSDHLLALDGLSVGGVNTVRGYRENQLVRDQGEYLNLEFDYPLLSDPVTQLSFNLIPFIDYGSAHNLGKPGANLSSAGLAGRLQWKGFHLDIAWAKRLHHNTPDTNTDSTLQDKGIHLQVSYKY